MATFKRYPDSFGVNELYPGVTIKDRETDLYIQYNIEDKLETVAYRVYSDPKLWWIIMLANPEYTMEYEIEPGETLRVPLPLNSVITEIRSQING